MRNLYHLNVAHKIHNEILINPRVMLNVSQNRGLGFKSLKEYSKHECSACLFQCKYKLS